MTEDVHARCREELERSRAETRAAFEDRALMYFHVLEVLSEDVGRDRAVELMKRAIHRRGLEVGTKYRQAAQAGDFEEVGRLFCETSPAGGQLFLPGVESISEDGVVLRMEACPLLDAWRGLGLPPEEVDVLCEIAAAIDFGTFEAAGLDLEFRERRGRPGAARCSLQLRKQEEGAGTG